jgi:hypothetical protein
MAWVRFDDGHHAKRKIRRAWRRHRATIGLHVMATTYSASEESDGLVDLDWLEGCLPVAKEREEVLALMVEVGLFHRLEAGETRVVVDKGDNEITLGPCGEVAFVVHDFLNFNPSSVQLDARRKDDRVRKASERSPDSVHADSERTSRADAPAPPRVAPARPRAGSGRVGSRETGFQGAEGEETNSQGGGEVGARAIEGIFAYWQQRCGHPDAKLSPDRRCKIKARLTEGRTVEEVRRAIDGAARAAHTSDAGQRFDDIELICRNGSKLELFMRRANLPSQRKAVRVVATSPASEEEVARWEELAGQLRGEVEESSWSSWLASLHPHGSPNGQLVLGTSPQAAGWIRERWGSMLDQLAGGSVEIVACGCEPAGKKGTHEYNQPTKEQ